MLFILHSSAQSTCVQSIPKSYETFLWHCRSIKCTIIPGCVVPVFCRVLWVWVVPWTTLSCASIPVCTRTWSHICAAVDSTQSAFPLICLATTITTAASPFHSVIYQHKSDGGRMDLSKCFYFYTLFSYKTSIFICL